MTGDPIIQICVDTRLRILFACCRDGTITAWDIGIVKLLIALLKIAGRNEYKTWSIEGT